MNQPPSLSSVQIPFLQPLQELSMNPYFIGFMMLMYNLIGRSMPELFTEEQMNALQYPAIKYFTPFIVFFMGTRNIIYAIILTTLFHLIVLLFLNNNSRFFVLRSISNYDIRKPIGSSA